MKEELIYYAKALFGQFLFLIILVVILHPPQFTFFIMAVPTVAGLILISLATSLYFWSMNKNRAFLFIFNIFLSPFLLMLAGVIWYQFLITF